MEILYTIYMQAVLFIRAPWRILFRFSPDYGKVQIRKCLQRIFIFINLFRFSSQNIDRFF